MKTLNVTLTNKVSNFNPVIIYPYKYRISVNPWYGCSINCKYCIQNNDNWYSTSAPSIDREKMLNMTISELKRIKSILPMFNLSLFDFSDPFLPNNINPLLSILSALDSLNLHLSVFITSKLNPGNNIIDKLTTFKNLAVSLFVSIGSMDKNIEPVSLKERITLIRYAYKIGIFTTVAFKPYVSEWLSFDKVKMILHSLDKNFHNILVSPLKLGDAVRKYLLINNILIPDLAKNNKDVSNLILKLKKLYPNKLITSRRSCGANFHFSRICNRKLDFLLNRIKYSQSTYKKIKSKLNSARIWECCLNDIEFFPDLQKKFTKLWTAFAHKKISIEKFTTIFTELIINQLDEINKSHSSNSIAFRDDEILNNGCILSEFKNKNIAKKLLSVSSF